MSKRRLSVLKMEEMARARRVEKDPRTEQMRHAMEAVTSGELGVNRSALQHGDRLSQSSSIHV